MKQGLVHKIVGCFSDKGTFSLKDAYRAIPDKPKETVRARIYENLGVLFNRVGKGIYMAVRDDCACAVIEGNGRDLSLFSDESIDCIITDHPWLDTVSNRGGNRSFSDYECFRYSLEDFKEKARVLKPGCFLVEFLPAENENNYEYLYEIKQMAKACGLEYYCKVSWKKGKFVSNTGRKAKNTQDIMIFSKGKARKLRLDVKRSQKEGSPVYMSGTCGMLPAMFDVEPVSRKDRIHQSELPLSLCEELLCYLTREGEIILDQFAGSGVIGEAACLKKRSAILIESVHELVEMIKLRLRSALEKQEQENLKLGGAV